MEQKEQFITPDLYLASAISILLNLQPTFKVENGRTLFCFPVGDDLYRTMGLYNGGVPISAIEFAEKIKRLRAEMIMRRGQK